MILKLAGVLVIALAGTGLGLFYASKEHFRLRDLAEMKKALLILSSEIGYLRASLPEACRRIAQKVNAPASPLFARFAQAMDDSGHETAYTLWAQALDAQKPQSALAAEDWDALADFGKTLGCLDTEMQLNAIRLALAYIDAKTAEVQSDCEKNRRLRRSAGLLGGLLLAVVLW